MGVEPTSELGPEKLARLLRIGDDEGGDPAQGNGTTSDQAKADLLQQMLGSVVPMHEFLAKSLPRIVQRACEGLPPMTTESRAGALLNSRSEIDLLQHIRDHAKGLAKNAHSDTEREVATVMYYAAIASALVFHDKRLSKSTYGKLEQAFTQLRAMDWLQQDISGLLEKASQVCKGKMDVED